MDFIFFVLKVGVQWVVHQLASRRIRNEQFSQAHQIKDNYSYVTGQHVVPMKQEARMIQLSSIGTTKETLDQLSHWILCHLIKISF